VGIIGNEGRDYYRWDRPRSPGVMMVWCVRMESNLLSTLHVWRVVASAFCITWPICVGKLWPLSVYAWIGCLWHIILLLTETMTDPSQPHVSVSTIRAESEKIVGVEPHCSHGYKIVALRPHCTSQLSYQLPSSTIAPHLIPEWLHFFASPRPQSSSTWRRFPMPISRRKKILSHGVARSSISW
jgi:hypothetical protein